MFNKIRLARLKRKIRRNPYIGKQDMDGAYLYKEDGQSIRYRISELSKGKIGIEWVSWRHRFSPYEEKIKKIEKGFFNFWHYEKWLIFFRPPVILFLIAGLFLFYSEIIETQEVKMTRLKWMIASVVGINPQEVQYIGGGWLEISGQRRRTVESTNEPTKYVYEPIKYTFNPLRWFLSSDAGFIKRWRSESYGYATHPVVYNEKGDVWVRKKDNWIHGQISGQTINWDTPQVTGMSLRKTPSHEISIEDKKLQIIDKQ